MAAEQACKRNVTTKSIKAMLIRAGLYRLDKRLKKFCRIPKYQMSFPPYGAETHKKILGSIDVVRYGAIALAVHLLQSERVPGAFAEVGVYQGELSAFIVSLARDRTLHLFDTFSGFPQQSHEINEKIDGRFADTSTEAVKRTIGNCANVVLHPGCFPETASSAR